MTEAAAAHVTVLCGGAISEIIDQVPAQRGVITLRDPAGRVVTVVATGHARAYIARKLGAAPGAGVAGASRDSGLGAVTASVEFIPAASMLEAELRFLAEAARHAPATYAACIERSAGWFVGADPGAEFPRFSKVSTAMLAHAESSADPRGLVGPVRDKHAAGKLIEGLQDVFDLCRYHHILVQAPRAAACVYKELGKCPAPCDGSEAMGSYRERFGEAVGFGVDAGAWLARGEAAMRDAAAGLDFERAAALHGRLAATRELMAGGARLAGLRWQDGWVSFSPGLARGEVRIMALGPYPARVIADVEAAAPEPEAARVVRSALSGLAIDRTPRDAAGWHALGLICDWMYRPASKRSNVRIVPAASVGAWDDAASCAWREAARRAGGDPGAEEDSASEALRLEPIGQDDSPRPEERP